MTAHDTALRRVLTITGLAVAISAVVTLGIDIPIGMRSPAGDGMAPGMTSIFEPILLAKVFISTFNLVVLLALGWSYLSVYRDLPNTFTRSLLVITGALFLYALSSNPVLHLLFGYHGGIGLGPFTFLPDLFAAVAVVLLLHQSYQ